MADTTASSPERWRNFSTQFPIAACRLERGDLKKIYRIMNEFQRQYRDKILSTLSQALEESVDQFERRKEVIRNAFVVSVTVAAENGEILTGNEDAIFDDPNFPTKLKNIYYSSQSVPEAILKHIPSDRIVLFLDFSLPPIFDLSRLPTLPTPNESNFEISATDATWFAAAKARLVDFFSERISGYDWLHRAGVYDTLLFLVGLPVAVWVCVRMESIIPSIYGLNPIPKALVYSYAFLLALTMFRLLFSYSRWVYPKVELQIGVSSHPMKHRAVHAALVIGVACSALWDVIKSLK